MSDINVEKLRAEIIKEVLDGLSISVYVNDGGWGESGSIEVALAYNGEQIDSDYDSLPNSSELF